MAPNKWVALGVRLKAARIAARLTQEEVAKSQKVTTQMVSYWEVGRSRPSVNRLPSLAVSYGVSVDSLLSDQAGDAEEGSLLEEAELALRSVGDQLTPEDIQSIRDFIRFVHDKRRREQDEQSR